MDLCPRADPEHHRLCLGDEAAMRLRLCPRPGLFGGGVPLCSSQERSWVGSGASTEGKGAALAGEGTGTSSEGEMWTAGSGRKANQAEGPEPRRAGCVWGALLRGRGSQGCSFCRAWKMTSTTEDHAPGLVLKMMGVTEGF